MDAEPVVKIQFLVEEELLDLEAAAKKFPHQVSHAIKLASDTINRATLQSIFSESLLSKRPKTPYRLHAVLASCSQNLLSNDSLEMHFFRRGGIQAVAALATTLADKWTASTLGSLPPHERTTLIDSIREMESHIDFQYHCINAQRWKLTAPVEATYLPRGRSSTQSKRSATQDSISSSSGRKRHRGQDDPLPQDRALSSNGRSGVLEYLPAEDVEGVSDAAWNQTGTKSEILCASSAHHDQMISPSISITFLSIR